MCKGGTEGCERLLSHSLVACVCNSHTSYFRIICYNILYRVFHKSGTVVSQVKINECKFRGLWWSFHWSLVHLLTDLQFQRNSDDFTFVAVELLASFYVLSPFEFVTHFEITNILVITTFFYYNCRNTTNIKISA